MSVQDQYIPEPIHLLDPIISVNLSNDFIALADVSQGNKTVRVNPSQLSSAFVSVVNRSGSTIPPLTPVRISGFDAASNRVTIVPAQADTVDNAQVFGFTTGQMLDDAGGSIIKTGRLVDVDTSSFSEGDILYLSPTVAGGLVTVKPDNKICLLGHVAQVGVAAGSVELQIEPPPLDLDTVTINFVIDGAGSVITTGKKGNLVVDFNCEILEWAVTADQSGSIVVDVNRATFAGYPTTASIAGTELPTISTNTKGEDRTLTSWSNIDAGDILGFEVDSVTTIQRVTVALKCRKL